MLSGDPVGKGPAERCRRRGDRQKRGEERGSALGEQVGREDAA